MKKTSLLLIGVLGAALATAGCPSATRYANNLSTLLVDESVQFEAVKALDTSTGITRHGESIGNTLEKWSDDAGQVVAELQKLANKMEQGSDEKSQVPQSTLDGLKNQIAQMMTHQMNVSLAIASWQMGAANKAVANVVGNYKTLPLLYTRIFKEQVNQDQMANISVVVVVDEAMKDTLPECEAEFTAMGLRESFCSSHADRVCSHQMNISCVTQKLLANAVSQQTCEMYGQDGKPTGLASSWYTNIKDECQATSPVLKHYDGWR